MRRGEDEGNHIDSIGASFEPHAVADRLHVCVRRTQVLARTLFVEDVVASGGYGCGTDQIQGTSCSRVQAWETSSQMTLHSANPPREVTFPKNVQ